MQMVQKRKGHRLDAWLERIASSDLAELQSFAAGVEKDKAAVKAGLTWPINNAQVEGQVTKLKLLKRIVSMSVSFSDEKALLRRVQSLKEHHPLTNVQGAPAVSLLHFAMAKCKRLAAGAPWTSKKAQLFTTTSDYDRCSEAA